MDTLELTAITADNARTVDNLFTLAIVQKSRSAKISMQMLNDEVNTSNIPFVVHLLKQHLPNVLKTQCFNEENLPFSVEVKNTETGHLFEHILLEYLCQLKIAKGSRSASFSGRTRWNWVKDPRGKFHISLSCGERDADILPLAIEKTIDLMKIVLQTEQSHLFSTGKLPSYRNGLKNGKRTKKNLAIS